MKVLFQIKRENDRLFHKLCFKKLSNYLGGKKIIYFKSYPRVNSR